MANYRTIVFGRWYGQAHSDFNLEAWRNLTELKRSLEIRDNGRNDRQQPAEQDGDSEYYLLGESNYFDFYADSNEYRWIDLYLSRPVWNADRYLWGWSVSKEPYARFTLGPRGGIRKELH